MASIFSKIIAGEIPCYKIAENESCFAFLDIRPLKKGHTLVVPKLEVDQLYQLPKEDYRNLQDFAYDVAQAIQKAIPCKRIGSAVLGMEVPHAHIHLIPLDQEGDLNFKNLPIQLEREEFEDIARLIKQQM